MPYGIITNCAAVFLGGILGAVLKNYFPQKLKEALPNIFGLSAITMGISLIIHVKKSFSRGTGPYRGNGHRRTSEPGG